MRNLSDSYNIKPYNTRAVGGINILHKSGRLIILFNSWFQTLQKNNYISYGSSGVRDRCQENQHANFVSNITA